jgi:hypothetical protein
MKYACWLEVSTNPEGPATDQWISVFRGFFAHTANVPLILTIQVALRASRAALPKLTSKFSLTHSPPGVTNIFVIMLPSKHKMQT